MRGGDALNDLCKILQVSVLALEHLHEFSALAPVIWIAAPSHTASKAEFI
jgi:hypothetical protein